MGCQLSLSDHKSVVISKKFLVRQKEKFSLSVDYRPTIFQLPKKRTGFASKKDEIIPLGYIQQTLRQKKKKDTNARRTEFICQI